MKTILTLLTLVAATYLLMAGIEGVVIFHEDGGTSSRIAWFSAFCIFCALALIVIPLTIPDPARAPASPSLKE